MGIEARVELKQKESTGNVGPAFHVMARVIAGMAAENLSGQEGVEISTLQLGPGIKQDQFPQYKSDIDFRNQVIFGQTFTRVEDVRIGGLRILGGGKTKKKEVTKALDIVERSDKVFSVLPELKTSSDESQDAFAGFLERILNGFEVDDHDNTYQIELFTSDGGLTNEGQQVIFESIRGYFEEAVDVVGADYAKALGYLTEVLGEYRSILTATEQKNLNPPIEIVNVLLEAKLATDLITTRHVINPELSIDQVVDQAREQRHTVTEVVAPDLALIEEVAQGYKNLQSKTYIPTNKAGRVEISDKLGVGMTVEMAYKFANMGFNNDVKNVARKAVEQINRDRGTKLTIGDFETLAKILIREKYVQEQELIASGEMSPEDASIMQVSGFQDDEIAKMFFTNEPIDEGVLSSLSPGQRKAVEISLNVIRLTGVVAAIAVPAGVVVQGIGEMMEDPSDYTWGNILHIDSDSGVVANSYANYTAATSGHGSLPIADIGDHAHSAISELGSLAKEGKGHVDTNQGPISEDTVRDILGNRSGERSISRVHSEQLLDPHSAEVREGELRNAPNWGVQRAGDGTQKMNYVDIKDHTPVLNPESTDDSQVPQHETTLHTDSGDAVDANVETIGTHVQEEVLEDHPEIQAEDITTHIAQPGDPVTEEQRQSFLDTGETYFEIEHGKTPSHAFIAAGLSNTEIFGEDGESGVWGQLTDGHGPPIAIHEGQAIVMVYDDPATEDHYYRVIDPNSSVDGTPANTRVLFIDLPGGMSIDDVNGIAGLVNDVVEETLQNNEESDTLAMNYIVNDIENRLSINFLESLTQVNDTISNVIEQSNHGVIESLNIDNDLEVQRADLTYDHFYTALTGEEVPPGVNAENMFQTLVSDDTHTVVKHTNEGGSGLFIIAHDSDSDGFIDGFDFVSFENEQQADELYNSDFSSTPDSPELTTTDFYRFVQEQDGITDFTGEAPEGFFEDVNDAAGNIVVKHINPDDGSGFFVRAIGPDADGNYTFEQFPFSSEDEANTVLGSINLLPEGYVQEDGGSTSSGAGLPSLIFSEVGNDTVKNYLSNDGIAVFIPEAGRVILMVAVNEEGMIITEGIQDDTKILEVNISDISPDKWDELSELYDIAEDRLGVNRPIESEQGEEEEHAPNQTPEYSDETTLEPASPEEIETLDALREGVRSSLEQYGVAPETSTLMDENGNPLAIINISVNSGGQIVTGINEVNNEGNNLMVYWMPQDQVPEDTEELKQLMQEKLDSGEIRYWDVFEKTFESIEDLEGGSLAEGIRENGVAVEMRGSGDDARYILLVAVDDDNNIITEGVNPDTRILEVDVTSIPSQEILENTELIYELAAQRLDVNPPVNTEQSEDTSNTVHAPVIINQTEIIPEDEVDPIFTQADPTAIILNRLEPLKIGLPKIIVNGIEIENFGFGDLVSITDMIDVVKSAMTIGMSPNSIDWLPDEIFISVGDYYEKIISERSSVATTPPSYTAENGFIFKTIAILQNFNEDVGEGENLEEEVRNIIWEEISQLVMGNFTLSFVNPDSANNGFEYIKNALADLGIDNINDQDIPDSFRTGQLAPWSELLQHSILEGNSSYFTANEEWDGLSDSGYQILVPNSNGEIVAYDSALEALSALNEIIMDIIGTEAVEEIVIPQGNFTAHLNDVNMITQVYTDPELLNQIQGALQEKGFNIFRLIGIQGTDSEDRLRVEISEDVIQAIQGTVQFPYDLRFDELLGELGKEDNSPTNYIPIDQGDLEKLQSHLEDNVIATNMGNFLPVREIVDPDTGLPGFVFDSEDPTHLAPINSGRGITPEQIINGEVSSYEFYMTANSDGATHVRAIPVGEKGLNIDTEKIKEVLQNGEININEIFELVYPEEQSNNWPEGLSDPSQVWGDIIEIEREYNSQNIQFLRIRTVGSDGTQNNTFLTVHTSADDHARFIVEGGIHGATPENTAILVITIPEDEIPEDRGQLANLLSKKFDVEVEEWEKNSSTPAEGGGSATPTVVPDIEPSETALPESETGFHGGHVLYRSQPEDPTYWEIQPNPSINPDLGNAFIIYVDDPDLEGDINHIINIELPSDESPDGRFQIITFNTTYGEGTLTGSGSLSNFDFEAFPDIPEGLFTTLEGLKPVSTPSTTSTPPAEESPTITPTSTPVEPSATPSPTVEAATTPTETIDENSGEFNDLLYSEELLDDGFTTKEFSLRELKGNMAEIEQYIETGTNPFEKSGFNWILTNKPALWKYDPELNIINVSLYTGVDQETRPFVIELINSETNERYDINEEWSIFGEDGENPNPEDIIIRITAADKWVDEVDAQATPESSVSTATPSTQPETGSTPSVVTATPTSTPIATQTTSSTTIIGQPTSIVPPAEDDITLEKVTSVPTGEPVAQEESATPEASPTPSPTFTPPATEEVEPTEEVVPGADAAATVEPEDEILPPTLGFFDEVDNYFKENSQAIENVGIAACLVGAAAVVILKLRDGTLKEDIAEVLKHPVRRKRWVPTSGKVDTSQIIKLMQAIQLDRDAGNLKRRFEKGEFTINDLAVGYRSLLVDGEGNDQPMDTLWRVSAIERYVENIKKLGIIPVSFDTESDPEIEINPNAGVISSSAHSVESIEHSNEDAFWTHTTEDGTNYMAVLDGVGGLQSQSAAVAVEILDTLSKDPVYDINSRPLSEVVSEIDSRLKERRDLHNQGTTLSLVRIKNNKLEGASVGDSPIMIIDEDNSSKRARIITRGHTLARLRDNEKTGIERDLALLDGSELEIKKAFGGLNSDSPLRNSYEKTITSDLNNPSRSLEIDSIEKQLRPGSKVVLFSDGLPKNMSLTEILLALEAGMTPGEIVGLAKAKSELDGQEEGAANHRLGIDDITMVVVEMGTIPEESRNMTEPDTTSIPATTSQSNMFSPLINGEKSIDDLVNEGSNPNEVLSLVRTIYPDRVFDSLDTGTRENPENAQKVMTWLNSIDEYFETLVGEQRESVGLPEGNERYWRAYIPTSTLLYLYNLPLAQMRLVIQEMNERSNYWLTDDQDDLKQEMPKVVREEYISFAKYMLEQPDIDITEDQKFKIIGNVREVFEHGDSVSTETKLDFNEFVRSLNLEMEVASSLVESSGSESVILNPDQLRQIPLRDRIALHFRRVVANQGELSNIVGEMGVGGEILELDVVNSDGTTTHTLSSSALPNSIVFKYPDVENDGEFAEVTLEGDQVIQVYGRLFSLELENGNLVLGDGNEIKNWLPDALTKLKSNLINKVGQEEVYDIRTFIDVVGHDHILSPDLPEKLLEEMEGIELGAGKPITRNEIIDFLAERVTSGEYVLETKKVEGLPGQIDIYDLVVVESTNAIGMDVGELASDPSNSENSTEINPILTDSEQEIVDKAVQNMKAAYYADIQTIGLIATPQEDGRMQIKTKKGLNGGIERTARFPKRAGGAAIHHVRAEKYGIFEGESTPAGFKVITSGYGDKETFYGSGVLRVFTSEYSEEGKSTEYSLMMDGNVSRGGEKGRGTNHTELDFVFADKEERDNLLKELNDSKDPKRLIAGLINQTFQDEGEPTSILNVEDDRNSGYDHPINQTNKIIIYDSEAKTGKIFENKEGEWVVGYESVHTDAEELVGAETPDQSKNITTVSERQINPEAESKLSNTLRLKVVSSKGAFVGDDIPKLLPDLSEEESSRVNLIAYSIFGKGKYNFNLYEIPEEAEVIIESKPQTLSREQIAILFKERLLREDDGKWEINTIMIKEEAYIQSRMSDFEKVDGINQANVYSILNKGELSMDLPKELTDELDKTDLPTDRFFLEEVSLFLRDKLASQKYRLEARKIEGLPDGIEHYSLFVVGNEGVEQTEAKTVLDKEVPVTGIIEKVLETSFELKRADGSTPEDILFLTLGHPTPATKQRHEEFSGDEYAWRGEKRIREKDGSFHIRYDIYKVLETVAVERTLEKDRTEVVNLSQTEAKILIERGLLSHDVRANKWVIGGIKPSGFNGIVKENGIGTAITQGVLSPELPESLISKVNEFDYRGSKNATPQSSFEAFISYIRTEIEGENPRYKIETRDIPGIPEKLGYQEIVIVENEDYKEPEFQPEGNFKRSQWKLLLQGGAVGEKVEEGIIRRVNREMPGWLGHKERNPSETYDRLLNGNLTFSLGYSEGKYKPFFNDSLQRLNLNKSGFTIDLSNREAVSAEEVEKLFALGALKETGMSATYEWNTDRNPQIQESVERYNQDGDIESLKILIYGLHGLIDEGAIPQELLDSLELDDITDETSFDFEHRANQFTERLAQAIQDGGYKLEIVEENFGKKGTAVQNVRVVKGGLAQEAVTESLGSEQLKVINADSVPDLGEESLAVETVYTAAEIMRAKTQITKAITGNKRLTRINEEKFMSILSKTGNSELLDNYRNMFGGS